MQKIENHYLKAKKWLLGMRGNDGFLLKVLIYGLLIGIGFVYLFPLLHMGIYSIKSLDDILNPLVNWIPTQFYLGNYVKANQVLNFFPVLLETLYVTVLPSVAQTAVAAVVGYGLARFNFRGKNILFVLVLATFLIPPQVTLIPRYIFFKELDILGSLNAFMLPALSGQGINSAIFILIFYQFFRMLPKSLEEAAQIDGAGHLRIFFTIAIPMAVPAIIISFLFSFVWYWNETYLASIYFGKELTTLPLQLQKFVASYQKMFPAGMEGSVNQINEGIRMAGTLLSILPLLIVYFITQKWFVEGVDRTGITGE
ncbi:carbohydrate ABC transporter permease [Lederbergia wuyishanensis]|uniref:Multiple sugar transport system permease protein n=1 Tax=Lederbergia wuyishanensis TaxID=1347903 RepID=A0ABU0D8K4_9BACI|nr:carbohydrate ABC transporter permease [Lederbergia wuyishanensis]MCJ8009190.1 carbohydrate ABC transporter permease [Lederbergia wuyishanensis]MDQ0344681.1 multiple sugar transport system permease protein [Lederbergia wuyishanensis]